MSTFKEPNYFVPGYGYEEWEDYLDLFSPARGESAIGESSTGYLYCPESPTWIKSVLGDVKVILMLRNPAHRAASLYWWMVREGYEDARTFAQALELEPSRAADPNFRRNCPQFYPDYLYYATGLYSGQVRRFLETFGNDKVRVYLFEEFTKDPPAVCREIFDFLDVNRDFEPVIAVHNEGRLPARAAMQFWLRNRAPRYLWFLPSRVRQKFLLQLMTLNVRRGSKPIHEIPLERRLLEHYRQDILELERILNRDLSLWFDNQIAAEPYSNHVAIH